MNDSRPDNLADDKFWACTYREVIKAACAIQERDGVIPDSSVFISPDEGWEEEDKRCTLGETLYVLVDCDKLLRQVCEWQLFLGRRLTA